MKQHQFSYRDINRKLIKKCREGNTNAQFRIYKLYYKAMYNTCLRVVNETAEAEDIMQEAFLAAFTRINEYSGDVSFGAWLKSIVINKSIDHLRKKKMFFEEIQNNITGESEDFDPLIQTESIEKQVDKIKSCISQLPEGCRVVLSLYLLEGYDHDEIAQILKISSSTSRSQYTRARKKLLQLIQN